jgi:hypothetical protein
MQRMHRYLSSVLLGVTLIAPIGIQAGNNFQDDGRQDARESNERDQRRYYERDHRDYHQWDDREDSRYRHWGEERHEALSSLLLGAPRAAESILEVSPRTSGS